MSLTKIFVLGDSISIQYGPYLEQALKPFVSYDRKQGNEAYLNLDKPTGANGGDSKMVLEYIKLFTAKNRPADIMILNCGLHDIKTDINTGNRQVSLEDFQKNLNEVVNHILNIGMKIIWVNITAVNDEIHRQYCDTFFRYDKDVIAYNEQANVIMKKNNIPIIKLNEFTQTLSEPLYSDHVHFHENIRKEQGLFIAGFIQCYVETHF